MKYTRPDRLRTTVPVKSTVRKVPLHLCAEADLALQCAGLWLHRAGGLKVPVSAIVRRALLLYAGRLGSADPLTEFRAAVSAATPLSTPAEEQQMALLRLYGADEAKPLPPFTEVLQGPYKARETAQMLARVDGCIRPLQTRHGAHA